jgi:hypothetical protein
MDITAGNRASAARLRGEHADVDVTALSSSCLTLRATHQPQFQPWHRAPPWTWWCCPQCLQVARDQTAANHT